jgi:CheY-like chemotaxis protein
VSQRKILVIDDDVAVRDAFDLALADHYQVTLAESGEQGLAAARAERPDLVFLDLKMPGMDGVETLRRLHELDAGLSVYIVTAFSQEYLSGLQAARADGLRFQLAAKPMSAEQIRLAAQSVLR